MAAFKRNKQQEIPFILDGKTIIKGVTKNTTCSDVINKLLNKQTPLAVFESVDGVEKELTGKTKLFKAWRAYGSAKKVEFVIRRSQILTKVKKSAPKLSSANKNCEKPSVRSALLKELSKDTLKQVSDLAFYVRYQKTKIQALNKGHGIDSGASEQNRLMRKMTSNASMNSMDAFLAKADLDEMAKFLSFCGEVTAEKLGKSKPKKQSAEYKEETVTKETKQTDTSTSGMKTSKHMIHESLKSMKLGLKQKFAPKRKVKRTTSTETVSSTDTGYHSVCSEGKSTSSSEDKNFTTAVVGMTLPKRHTFVFSEGTYGPRNSTPVFAGRTKKLRVDDFESTFTPDSTLTTENLEQMNELQGKTMILKKFIADQTMPVKSSISENDVISDSPDMKRRHMERYSMPAFSNQKDVCRFLWNQDSDSDLDSESDVSEPLETLDLAFNTGEKDWNETMNSGAKTLRRESAISNLNHFSLLSRDIGLHSFNESKEKTLRRESAMSNLNRFSHLSRGIGLDTFDESDGFDYSFDCSFPRMDETQTEDFSLDFSYDFDDSDSEAGSSEDESMDSFMKTRSFLDLSGDLTMCEHKDDFNKDCLDEGEGSCCSRNVSDCHELEIII